MASRRVVISANSGTGGDTSFYYDTATAKFYATADFTQEPITAIRMHTRECFRSNGYTSGSGASQIVAVGSNGTINPDYVPASSGVYIYAQWTHVSYKITVNKNNGAEDVVFYRDINSPLFYADDQCEQEISQISLTTREGYTATGAYSASTGGTKYVDELGYLEDALYNLSITANKTFYHQWQANQYLLSFDYNGGNVDIMSKYVTYDENIGALPAATIARGVFLGWYIGNTKITSTTKWKTAGNATAVARWRMFFRDVTDYFGLASATLVPESSDSGDNKQHLCQYNAQSETPATETSGTWRNPRVTYRVVGDMTLNVTLGAAFAGVAAVPNGMARSGYMIASVEVHTVKGEAPAVTVSAVANEGYTWNSSGTTRTAMATPAVKTYAVAIPITARHRPQNLLNAISGSGDMQELTLVARGDPVVIAENGMPCASDMTHGHYEVSATVANYDNENEPTADNGFVMTATPLAQSGVGYRTYRVSARKEMV